MARFETIEEILDYQIAYFSQPGAQLAKGDEGDCMYRTEDNYACAIGCLLKDEEYYGSDFKRWEGTSVAQGIYDDLVSLGVISSFSKDDILWYLQKTQDMHDNEAHDAEELVRLLQEFKREIVQQKEGGN